MRFQRRLEGIAPLPIEAAQLTQMLQILVAADPLQGLPLTDAVGMQICRLLEFEQMREQVRAGDQVTDA
ncbi:hypothetical protein D1872_342560 [compost metagenome]